MATFIYPTVKRVSSHYSPSRKHPKTGEITYHSGTDFAQAGYHEIKASAAGKVTHAGNAGTYGNRVIIEHNINGKVWQTLYAHLRNGSIKVKVGQSVKQGQVIGVMGSTGRVTGQHLHFELHKGKWNSARSNAVDPLKYLGKNLTPKPYTQDAKWPKLENYGPNVGKWQRKLKDLGYYKGKIDNSFGPQTDRATKVFQKAHNLAVDGQAGPASNKKADELLARKNFKVGQKVRVKQSAKKYSRVNKNIPSFVKQRTHTIQQVGKNDVLLKEIVSWVKKSDIQ